MLCGAFQLDDPKLNLLSVLLPPLLHIKTGTGTTSPQLRALIGCIETELKVSQPGEQAIVTRMAEAFLLRAIRDFVLSSSNGAQGLPAILRDRSIGRVLGLIHQQPEQAWTVASLADAANLSGSGFAARFRMRVAPLRSVTCSATASAKPSSSCKTQTPGFTTSPPASATTPSPPSAKPSSARWAKPPAPTANASLFSIRPVVCEGTERWPSSCPGSFRRSNS
jgi:hypothetical protein